MKLFEIWVLHRTDGLPGSCLYLGSIWASGRKEAERLARKRWEFRDDMFLDIRDYDAE